ncbi:hypothetical protein [Vibrio cincinnatiensis]|uniref:hypothetical protein n=1 Tax=Vibrio cincinnatiensis TaxID=675 RepID=UPI001302AADC|nr:hypothetical protein [Vibrio cincinnatiensis]
METMKEAGRWHRPVNQIMDLSFTKLDANTDIQQITYLICEQNLAFPWILVDGKQFKGIITQQIIVNHLAQLQHASVAEAEFSI